MLGDTLERAGPIAFGNGVSRYATSEKVRNPVDEDTPPLVEVIPPSDVRPDPHSPWAPQSKNGAGAFE